MIQNVVVEIIFNWFIYEFILQVFLDYQLYMLVDLVVLLVYCNLNLLQVIDLVLMLIGIGYVVLLFFELDVVIQVQIVCCMVDLNVYFLQCVVLVLLESQEGDIVYLVSLLIGGGVKVDWVEQLFLLVCEVCGDDVEVWFVQVWQYIVVQGKWLVCDGVWLEVEDENLVELVMQVWFFVCIRLFLLWVLQVV